MLFLEFGLGMIVWIGAITILHRNADHKKLKTVLINYSPAILYGLLATSYVTLSSPQFLYHKFLVALIRVLSDE